jgi:hypothetical protein
LQAVGAVVFEWGGLQAVVKGLQDGVAGGKVGAHSRIIAAIRSNRAAFAPWALLYQHPIEQGGLLGPRLPC